MTDVVCGQSVTTVVVVPSLTASPKIFETGGQYVRVWVLRLEKFPLGVKVLAAEVVTIDELLKIEGVGVVVLSGCPVSVGIDVLV